jgi:DNA polymerase V
MFALVDCNNFYVSCERIFRPDLHNKPVVVLSNNDGCAISRSNEAKELGIPMGAVAFQYKDLFKKHNVEIFSTNFTLYGDISKRVMKILSRFTANIEVYSVDEAFLDLSHIQKENLNEYGKLIRNTVLQEIGIPISIGIAATKTLSKVANHVSKNFKGYENVFVIDSEARRLRVLQYLPIEKVWGIGRNYATTLGQFGVKTAYDFTQLSDALVLKKMSVVGKRLKKELEGTPCLETEEILAKKNIATTRTFGSSIEEKEQLETAIATHAANCCTKLRKQNSAAQFVYVFLRTNKHRKDEAQYRNGITITLNAPHNSSIAITKAALKALNILYKPGFQYKRAGVVLSGIVPAGQVQRSFFEEVDRDKHQKLMTTLDSINAKAGKNKIHLAVQDIKKNKFFKRELLSPNFTTSWSDILVVKAK